MAVNLRPLLKNFFKFRSSHCASRNPFNWEHIRPDQVTLGSNIFGSIGPVGSPIWNGSPNEIIFAENSNTSKQS